MIGTLISMRYIGKRDWRSSLIFWAVILVLGIVLSYVLSYVVANYFPEPPAASIFDPSLAGLAVTSEYYAGVFTFVFLVLFIRALLIVLLAKFWYKFPWIDAIKIWVVAFIVDFIISILLANFGIIA